MSLLSDYFTEPDLAAELGLTVRGLQLWRTKRCGPAWTKLGKRVVYRRAAVSDWMKAQEQQPVRSNQRAA